MIIRELTAAEVPQLLVLAEKMFRDTFTHNNTPEAMESYIAQDYTLEAFERDFAEPTAKCFLICDDDKIIGYLRVRRNSEADHLIGSNNIEIQRLYVDKAYHGLKVADRLMQLAIDIAKGNKR